MLDPGHVLIYLSKARLAFFAATPVDAVFAHVERAMAMCGVRLPITQLRAFSPIAVAVCVRMAGFGPGRSLLHLSALMSDKRVQAGDFSLRCRQVGGNISVRI